MHLYLHLVFTSVKSLKIILSIDRLRMTFAVEGNGKKYVSDYLLFLCLGKVHLIWQGGDEDIETRSLKF